jgi:hypothetical protein
MKGRKGGGSEREELVEHLVERGAGGGIGDVADEDGRAPPGVFQLARDGAEGFGVGTDQHDD